MIDSLGTCLAAGCLGEVIVEAIVGSICEGRCNSCGLEFASPIRPGREPEPEKDWIEQETVVESMMINGAAEQRSRALERAQNVRLQRVALKRRIQAEGRAGAAIAARVLERNPELIHTLDIGELLLWVPGFAKDEARRLLDHRHANPWDRIGDLSERKRRLLAGDLLAFSEGGARPGLRVRQARELPEVTA